jgi:thymidylate synthase
MSEEKAQTRTGLYPVFIEAFDLDDAWFKCLFNIFKYGYEYTIDHGSYEGQKRFEFDFVTVHVKKPHHQILPLMPEGAGLVPPTSMAYIQDYMLYLMTGEKTEREDYTYGERLVDFKVRVPREKNGHRMIEEIPLNINQVDEVIKMYKEKGYETNQATMEIGMPSDIQLADPPCCRLIDTRIRYGKLHFIIYFRSWDLYAGFPSNLGGMELLKQYMADLIGVENGEMVAISKGMHVYDHCYKYALARTKQDPSIMESAGQKHEEFE